MHSGVLIIRPFCCGGIKFPRLLPLVILGPKMATELRLLLSYLLHGFSFGEKYTQFPVGPNTVHTFMIVEILQYYYIFI